MLVFGAGKDQAQSVLSFEALERRSLVPARGAAEAVLVLQPVFQDAICERWLGGMLHLHLPHPAHFGEVSGRVRARAPVARDGATHGARGGGSIATRAADGREGGVREDHVSGSQPLPPDAVLGRVSLAGGLGRHLARQSTANKFEKTARMDGREHCASSRESERAARPVELKRAHTGRECESLCGFYTAHEARTSELYVLAKRPFRHSPEP